MSQYFARWGATVTRILLISGLMLPPALTACSESDAPAAPVAQAPAAVQGVKLGAAENEDAELVEDVAKPLAASPSAESTSDEAPALKQDELVRAAVQTAKKNAEATEAAAQSTATEVATLATPDPKPLLEKIDDAPVVEAPAKSPAASQKPVSTKVAPKPQTTPGAPEEITFEQISDYYFSYSPAAEDEQANDPDASIPAEIKAMDGRKVSIVGFMIPVDFQEGKTNEFILSGIIPGCFFCDPPRINEWIEVKTKGGQRVPYNGDDPLIVTGTLSVGAMVENGAVLSVYRMEAEAVTPENPN